MLTYPQRNAGEACNAATYLNLINEVLQNDHISPLLTHYVRSNTARVDCLIAIENVAFSWQPLLTNTSSLLQHLYCNYELVDDESIKEWFYNVATHQSVKSAAQPFITWLESAEEETDDDDE